MGRRARFRLCWTRSPYFGDTVQHPGAGSGGLWSAGSGCQATACAGPDPRTLGTQFSTRVQEAADCGPPGAVARRLLALDPIPALWGHSSAPECRKRRTVVRRERLPGDCLCWTRSPHFGDTVQHPGAGSGGLWSAGSGCQATACAGPDPRALGTQFSTRVQEAADCGPPGAVARRLLALDPIPALWGHSSAPGCRKRRTVVRRERFPGDCLCWTTAGRVPCA